MFITNKVTFGEHTGLRLAVIQRATKMSEFGTKVPIE